MGAALAWGIRNKAKLFLRSSSFVNPTVLDFCSTKIGWLSWVGLLMIVIAIFGLDEEKLFPGFWAVLPAFGAFLIISVGESSRLNTIFLSAKPVVWLGLISYPLYLWHWPIISFGHIVNMETPHRDFKIAAVLLSILLAWLTYRFVELKFRSTATVSATGLKMLVGCMCSLAILGAVLTKGDFSKSHTLASLNIQRDGAEHFVAGSNAWYEGRNGWLFLGNRYNDTISKLRLADMPSSAEISTVYRQFDEILSSAQSVGAQVALLIGPNKSSVYPEHLPDEVTPSSRRYVDFFLQQLEDIDGLIVHDPTSDLIAQSKILGNLYWRTDTHWNPLGAFVAYSGLMDELGMESVNVAFRPGGGYKGDLIRISGREDFAVQDDDNWIAVYESEPNWKEVSGAVREDDPFGNRQTVINSNSLVDKYVWVVGDSFVARQRDYLNSTFSEVDYIGHWSKLLDEIPSKLLRAQRKPDLILIIRVERSF